MSHFKLNKVGPTEFFQPRTIDTLTPEDLDLSFKENSNQGRDPLTWLKLVSSFNMLEMDMEELANKNEEWKRLIELYKQKCQVTISNCIKKNPRLAWEYYQAEYGSEMSVKEKMDEGYEEEDNS